MQKNYPNTILYDFEPGDVVTIHRTWGPVGPDNKLSRGFADRYVGHKTSGDKGDLWMQTITRIKGDNDDMLDIGKSYQKYRIIMVILSINKRTTNGIKYKIIKGRVTWDSIGSDKDTILTFRLSCDTDYIVGNGFRTRDDLCNPREAVAPLNIHQARYLAGESNATANQISMEPGQFDKWKTSNIVANQYGKKWGYRMVGENGYLEKKKDGNWEERTSSKWGDNRKEEPDAHWCTWFELVNEDGHSPYFFGNDADKIEWNCWTMILTAQGSLIKYIKDVAIKSNGRASMIGNHGFFTAGLQKHQTRYRSDTDKSADYDTGTPMYSKNVIFLKTEACIDNVLEGQQDTLWSFYPYQGITGISKTTLDVGEKMAPHAIKAYRIICKCVRDMRFPERLRERNWIVTWDENDLYDGHDPGIHFEWVGSGDWEEDEDIKMPTSFLRFVSTQKAGAINVVLSEFNQHLREEYTKAVTKSTDGTVLFSGDHPKRNHRIDMGAGILTEQNYIDAQYMWDRGEDGDLYEGMVTHYHLTMGVIHDKVGIVVNGKDNSQQNHFRFLPRTWIPDIADGLEEDGRLYVNFLKSLISIRDTDNIDPIFHLDTLWRGILMKGMRHLYEGDGSDSRITRMIGGAWRDKRNELLINCRQRLYDISMQGEGTIRTLGEYFEWGETVPDWVVEIDPNDKILQRILGAGTSHYDTPKWVRLYNDDKTPVFPYGYSWVQGKEDDAQIRYVEVATPSFSLKPKRLTLVNENALARPNILSKIRPGSIVYIGFGPNVGETYKYSLGFHEPIGYTFFKGNIWETTHEDNKYVVLNSDLKLKALRKIRHVKKLKEREVRAEGKGRSIQFTAKEVAATLCSVNTQLNPNWMEQLFLTHEHKIASPDWNFADRIESRVEEFWEECENQITKFYSVPKTWTLRNFLWELVAQRLSGESGRKIYSSEFNLNELLKRVYSIKIYYSRKTSNSARQNKFAGPQLRNRIQMPSELCNFDTFHEGMKYEIVLNMLTEDKLNMRMDHLLQYEGLFQEEMSNYSEGSTAAIGAKSFKIDVITYPLVEHTTTKIKVKAIFPNYVQYITTMTIVDSLWKSGREDYKSLSAARKKWFFKARETNPSDLIYELCNLLPPNTNTVRKNIGQSRTDDYEVEYIPDAEIITILNNKHKAGKKGKDNPEIKRLIDENKALDRRRRNEVLYHWEWMKRFLIPDGCEFLLIENPDRLVECRAWWESREGDIIPSPYPYFTTYNNPISRWKKGSVERELVPSELGPGKFVEMWNSLSMEQAIIEVEKDNFGKVGLLMKHYVYSKIGKQLNNAHNIFISLPQGQKINVLSLFLGHSARPKKQHPDLKRKVSDEVFTTAQDGEIDFLSSKGLEIDFLSSKGLYIHELKYLNIENPCWFNRYNYTIEMSGMKISFIPNESGIVNIVSRHIYRSIDVKTERLRDYNKQGSIKDYRERKSDDKLIGKTTVQNIVERVYEMSIGEDAQMNGGMFLLNGEPIQPFPNSPLTRNWNDVRTHFNKITISVAGKGTYNLYENGTYNNSLFYLLGLKEPQRSGDEPFGIKLVRKDKVLDLGFKNVEITFHSKEINSETRDIVEKLELDTMVTQKETDVSRRGYIYIDGETRTLLTRENQYNPRWSLLTSQMLNFLVATYNLKTPGESGYELPYTAVEDFEDMIFKTKRKTTGSPMKGVSGVPQVETRKKIPKVEYMTKLERIEQVCGLLATKHREKLAENQYNLQNKIKSREMLDEGDIDDSIEWRDTTCMLCKQPGAIVMLECGTPEPEGYQEYAPHIFHMSCLYKTCLKRSTYDENINAMTEAATSINILHKINLDQYMTCVTIPEATATNVAIDNGGIPPEKQYVSTMTVRTFLHIRAQMKIKNAEITATYIPMDAIQALPCTGWPNRYFIDAGINHRRVNRGYLNMNHLNEDEKYIAIPGLLAKDRLVGRQVQIRKSRDRDITYTSEDAPATNQVPNHKMALEHMHQKIYTWTENSHCPACRTLVGTRVLTCRPIGFETHKKTLMYCGQEVYEEESLKVSFPPLIKTNGVYEWDKYPSKWALFRYQPHARGEVYLERHNVRDYGRGGLELAYHELSQFIENPKKFQTNNSPKIYNPCRYAKLIGKKQKMAEDVKLEALMDSRYRTYRLKKDDGYIDLPDILRPYGEIKDQLKTWLVEAEKYLKVRDEAIHVEATEWWRESFLDIKERYPETVVDGEIDLKLIPKKWTFQPMYVGALWIKPRITIDSNATIQDLYKALGDNMRKTYETYEIEFKIPDHMNVGEQISLGQFGFRDTWPQRITLKEEDKDDESNDAKWKIYSMSIFKTNMAEEAKMNAEYKKLIDISEGLWKFMYGIWDKLKADNSLDFYPVNNCMEAFLDKGTHAALTMDRKKNTDDVYVLDIPLQTDDGKAWLQTVQQWLDKNEEKRKLNVYFKLQEKYSKKVITRILQQVNRPVTAIYPGVNTSLLLTDVIKRPAKMNKKNTFACDYLPWPYVGENCSLIVHASNKPDKSDTRIKIKVEFRYMDDDSLIEVNEASATVVDVGLEDNMDSFWDSMKRTQWFQNPKAWRFKNDIGLPSLTEGGRILFDLEPNGKRNGRPYYDANTHGGAFEYLESNPWSAHCQWIKLSVSSEDVRDRHISGSRMKDLFRPALRKEEVGGGVVTRSWKHQIELMGAMDELDTIGDDISRDNKLPDSAIGVLNPWFVSQDKSSRPYRDDSCTKKYITMGIYYNKKDRFDYGKFDTFPWYNNVQKVFGARFDHRYLAQVEVRFKDRLPGEHSWGWISRGTPSVIPLSLLKKKDLSYVKEEDIMRLYTAIGKWGGAHRERGTPLKRKWFADDLKQDNVLAYTDSELVAITTQNIEDDEMPKEKLLWAHTSFNFRKLDHWAIKNKSLVMPRYAIIEKIRDENRLKILPWEELTQAGINIVYNVSKERGGRIKTELVKNSHPAMTPDMGEWDILDSRNILAFSKSRFSLSLTNPSGNPDITKPTGWLTPEMIAINGKENTERVTRDGIHSDASESLIDQFNDAMPWATEDFGLFDKAQQKKFKSIRNKDRKKLIFTLYRDVNRAKTDVAPVPHPQSIRFEFLDVSKHLKPMSIESELEWGNAVEVFIFLKQMWKSSSTHEMLLPASKDPTKPYGFTDGEWPSFLEDLKQVFIMEVAVSNDYKVYRKKDEDYTLVEDDEEKFKLLQDHVSYVATIIKRRIPTSSTNIDWNAVEFLHLKNIDHGGRYNGDEMEMLGSIGPKQRRLDNTFSTRNVGDDAETFSKTCVGFGVTGPNHTPWATKTDGYEQTMDIFDSTTWTGQANIFLNRTCGVSSYKHQRTPPNKSYGQLSYRDLTDPDCYNIQRGLFGEGFDKGMERHPNLEQIPHFIIGVKYDEEIVIRNMKNIKSIKEYETGRKPHAEMIFKYYKKREIKPGDICMFKSDKNTSRDRRFLVMGLDEIMQQQASPTWFDFEVLIQIIYDSNGLMHDDMLFNGTSVPWKEIEYAGDDFRKMKTRGLFPYFNSFPEPLCMKPLINEDGGIVLYQRDIGLETVPFPRCPVRLLYFTDNFENACIQYTPNDKGEAYCNDFFKDHSGDDPHDKTQTMFVPISNLHPVNIVNDIFSDNGTDDNDTIVLGESDRDRLSDSAPSSSDDDIQNEEDIPHPPPGGGGDGTMGVYGQDHLTDSFSKLKLRF